MRMAMLNKSILTILACMLLAGFLAPVAASGGDPAAPDMQGSQSDGLPSPSEEADVQSHSQLASSSPYHGNINTRVFHRQGCRYYNCKNCIMVFQSREDALDAGFRPCKVCGP